MTAEGETLDSALRRLAAASATVAEIYARTAAGERDAQVGGDAQVREGFNIRSGLMEPEQVMANAYGVDATPDPTPPPIPGALEEMAESAQQRYRNLSNDTRHLEVDVVGARTSIPLPGTNKVYAGPVGANKRLVWYDRETKTVTAGCWNGSPTAFKRRVIQVYGEMRSDARQKYMALEDSVGFKRARESDSWTYFQEVQRHLSDYVAVAEYFQAVHRAEMAKGFERDNEKSVWSRLV